MKFFVNLMGAVLVLSLFSFTNVSTTEKRLKVVIDAGHGGEDNGTVYDEITEKEITEAISRKIKFLNFDKSVEVIVLRDKDEFISLSDRVQKINELKPDLLISLHVNSNSDTTLQGFETFVSTNNESSERSKEIAEYIYEAAPKSLTKSEVKESNFYLLNHVSCPAVLLELGYISNRNDREYLVSQIGQQRIAESIVKIMKSN